MSQPERGQNRGIDVREGNDPAGFQRAEKCEDEKHVHRDRQQRDDDHLEIAEIELAKVVVSEVVEQSRDLILRQFWIYARCPHRLLYFVGGDSLGGSESQGTCARQQQNIYRDVDAREETVMNVP